MKPCPCGFAGDRTRTCVCAESQIARYRSRLSGPLLDRIDLHLTLSPVPLRALGAGVQAESSAAIRARVQRARARQRQRSGTGAVNSRAGSRRLLAEMHADARGQLEAAAETMQLSARAYNRVARVARTIADLDEADRIGAPHVAEALRYRPVERAVTSGAL